MQQKSIVKTYLETWDVMGYKYQIHEINAGGEKWLEANPITKGATRTAENETILRILLQNDAKNIKKFQQRVR